MVDLGCQDTDWVDGKDKDILDAISLQSGLISSLEGELFSPFALNFHPTAKNQGIENAAPLNFIWKCYHGQKAQLHK